MQPKIRSDQTAFHIEFDVYLIRKQLEAIYFATKGKFGVADKDMVQEWFIMQGGDFEPLFEAKEELLLAEEQFHPPNRTTETRG